MPYEDDYKKWLEEMLIESNPDWVCDGMYDLEFTHEWCGEHCGEDSNYVTPKCLHLYYHHIARADRKTEPSNSEKPNNCEHITEDGVTCARYPACDDCLDSPLNKVKGSERLVKGSEQTEPTISKMEQVEEPQKDCYMCKWLGEVNVCGRCRNRNLFAEAEPQPRCPKCGKRGYIRSLESMGVKLKVFDEYRWKCTNCNKYFKEEPKDEPQTERSE